MSDLFRLSGKLKSEPFAGGGGELSLYRKQPLGVSHIRDLLEQTENVVRRFENNGLFEGILLSLRYNDVVSKSRRVQSFFKIPRGSDCDKYIVGAKMDFSSKRPRHVITYFVPRTILQVFMDDAHAILDALQDTEYIQNEALLDLSKAGQEMYRASNLKCARVARFFADCSNVDEIFLPRAEKTENDYQLVTIYDVNLNIVDLLTKLKIPFSYGDLWGDRSVALSKSSYEMLLRDAGYLIAMSEIRNREDLAFDATSSLMDSERTIPSPSNEPIIGVIDTSFDSKVYYSEWVDVHDDFLLMKPPTIEDMRHATEVCSIIADGPTLNPHLDDHCGRFRVRLFPVASSGMNSWINIAESVRKIVKANPDIHVWNFSLGSNLEVDENYVSPMASILDELQSEDPNLLFVVAGTNLPPSKKDVPMRIGAPADSINSLVVNSVDSNGNPACYSRKGPVLSFFRKPDISYYGGDGVDGINVMVSSSYETGQSGTSFAAPWIARKACFLIDVMGFSREETKALLIDSALSFEHPAQNMDYLGYGVVPIAIEDVVESRRDEVRFMIKGQSQTYYTATYDLPIPFIREGFPFKARVVLASVLSCDRNKGVDYTNEELAISFGRMKDGKIVTINGDKQEETGIFTDEETSRSLFRKWDNVKVIQQTMQKRRVAVKNYDEMGRWGLRVSSKLRNDAVKKPRQARFAAVITLKEIYGQDRSGEFERLCLSRGWLVQRINVANKVHLHNEASADIHWD